MDGDLVGGPTTTELAGACLVYRYSTGPSYRLEFTDKTVTFQLRTDPVVASRAGTLPYRARKLRDDLYLVHWLPPTRTVHVALVIDLARRKIHVSGLMPGRQEFFDMGEIEEMSLGELDTTEWP
jgi:phenolic acid decarboxylase